MGRLVRREELHAKIQSAANQIGQHILGGMSKLEDNVDARLARIEKELGLPPLELGRAVMLVGPKEIPEGGSEARSIEPSGAETPIDVDGGHPLPAPPDGVVGHIDSEGVSMPQVPA